MQKIKQDHCIISYEGKLIDIAMNNLRLKRRSGKPTIIVNFIGNWLRFT